MKIRFEELCSNKLMIYLFQEIIVGAEACAFTAAKLFI